MLETYREPWVDFLSIETLCRRAGCTASDLAMVAAKELVDNALDASPSGIDFEFRDRTLIIADNGPGLVRERALAIFDVKRPSLSSKRWRLAKRGALGNGIRVVMGVCYVSGGQIRVSSKGTCLTLRVAANGTTEIADEHPCDVIEGTRVELTFGPKIAVNGAEIEEYATKCCAAVGSAFGGTKAVPSWFDASAIKALLMDMSAETSVLEFARCFDLTAGALAEIKSVAMRMTCQDLLADEDGLEQIIAAILAGQKGARKLHAMGRNARPGAYSMRQVPIKLGAALIPAIVECWANGRPVADRKFDGKVIVSTLFANRTPAIMRDGHGLADAKEKQVTISLGGWWFEVTDMKGPCHFNVELALTAPELPLISDGKAIDLEPFNQAILAVLGEALPRAYIAPQRIVKQQTLKPLTIKEAVFETIEATYASVAAAGIGAPPRMLMYRSRPEILRLTGRKELNYATFNSALLAFLDENPAATKDWSILYDDRGHFTEPNRTAMGLGTLAVDQFILSMGTNGPIFEPQPWQFNIDYDNGSVVPSHDPAHRFGAVIFVEKEGYTELIRKAEIAKRFDVAFASSKGMPTTAVRRLLDALAAHGIATFCLHDFDIAGLTIAYNLSNSNERYTFANRLKFSDMGLRLADAHSMGLQSEPFKLDEKTDQARLRDRLASYGATAAEIDMLVNKRHRVEIDAMTPRQLIDFIEQKLVHAGISKIIPPIDVMSAHFRKAAMDVRMERALHPIRQKIEADLFELANHFQASGEAEIRLPERLPAAVGEYLRDNPTAPWTQAVEAVAITAELEKGQ